MNDPEVIMLDALPTTGLTVHRRALEAGGLAMRLAARVPAPYRTLWGIAYASAKEVDTHLRLLTHARAVHVEQATAALRLFDEVRAMTWRLLHPKPE